LKLRDMTPTRRELFLGNCEKLSAQNALARERLALAKRVGPRSAFSR
jgi:hypothetical protein